MIFSCSIKRCAAYFCCPFIDWQAAVTILYDLLQHALYCGRDGILQVPQPNLSAILKGDLQIYR